MLFGVIQGGTSLELRRQCAEALTAIGFNGYGFGARHVDEGGKFLAKPLSYTADLIPEDKLRFGLGIGAPRDIIRAVKMGWDMFDCVIPTREARHGKLYIWKMENRKWKIDKKKNPFSIFHLPFSRRQWHETINITNAKFIKDFSPINPASKLPELRAYTKAYLHHLFKTQEPLALRLATLNNLEFYLDLMSNIQKAIKAGEL